MARRTGTETQTAILQAALDQISILGYAATTLESVGAQLGITRAAVLFYFHSKPELLSTLVLPLITGLEADLDAYDRHPEPDSPSATLSLLAALATTLAANGQVVGVMLDPASTADAEMGVRIGALRRRAINAAAGSSDCPRMKWRAAVTVSSLVHAFKSNYATFYLTLPVEQRVDLLVSSTWASLNAGGERFPGLDTSRAACLNVVAA